MKTILLLVAMFGATAAYSQVQVDSNSIGNHIGDTVRYCGKVVSARLMERMSAAPAFLNIDGAYPHQVFTVVIWKDDRLKFTNKPEVYYTDKRVCITGKLEKFREQLQIVVKDEGQMVVE